MTPYPFGHKPTLLVLEYGQNAGILATDLRARASVREVASKLGASMKPITILILATFLTACAPRIYSRPDSGEADFAKDKAQCTYEVTSHTQTGPFSDPFEIAFNRAELMDLCLQGRGWVRQ